MKWSNVNKLQLNLVKSKEIVFRRSNVQLDILPVHLSSIEQLECVKLLGVFIDSKLSFSVHVEHLLTVCIAVVYDVIVLSKVLYAVWMGWIHKSSTERSY